MKTLLIAGIALLFIAGCSATKESRRDQDTPPDDEVLRRYELEFEPSDFDQDRQDSSIVPAPATEIPGEEPAPAEPSVAQEVVPGYRVQVYSTTSIDTAKARLAAFRATFPEEWFYLDFDPPTYKIRAGNFLTRYEADRFARVLADHGIRSAWSVPQRVFKNPPPHARIQRE
jgi:hypothetical protein